MTAFVNGRFIPEEEAMISALDRGFTYGDGLFETMRVAAGTLVRWNAHLQRLERGAEFLGIRLPMGRENLGEAATGLVKESRMAEGALRLVVSRGVGMRGYSPQGAETPSVVMTIHALPQRPEALRLRTSSYRLLAGDPLLQHKTCNKLLQVMARQEAEREGFDEALLLNNRDEVVTATSANLFWISGDAVRTAPVEAGALPGITRGIFREICAAAGIEYVEGAITGEKLATAAGVFLTSTTLGMIPVAAVDGRRYDTPKILHRLKEAYAQIMAQSHW
jgi:branched-chain amino acid aminotransferase